MWQQQSPLGGIKEVITAEEWDRKEGRAGQVKKAPAAGVHVALAGGSQVTSGRAQKRCKFTDMAGFTGSHSPWLCRAFRDKAPGERSKIIKDNKLCPFCLLHDADEVLLLQNQQNEANLRGTWMQGAAH